MSKKGKKNDKHKVERIVLVTTIINLIIAIVDLISRLLD